MKHRTRFASRLAIAFLLATVAALAHAQAWPEHPVRIVIPYPPGGGTDTLARLVGQKLGDAWKQPVVLENRAGGNAVIGMDVVRKAAPDGYTLMAIAAGPLDESNLAAFTPIALFAAPSYMLVVHPSLKATSVRELVALGKAQPGKIAYGSTGAGAASHLASELFKAMTDADMLHVSYKGVGAAVTDLIGGHV